MTPSLQPLPIRHRGRFWAVIPAGGSGSRLWPLSRAARPKFLLPLLGERSLLQRTYDRLCELTDPLHIIVVCGPAHVAAIARQLPDLPAGNIIVEPSPNGTGPALALATALIAGRDPDAIIGSFAADHEIAELEPFLAALRSAIHAAESGYLVTIGIEPTRPETGYGYIERTTEVVSQAGSVTAFRANRFVEKPDLETAQSYLDQGTFLWNAGMFVWNVSSALDELERQQPVIAAGVRQIAASWDSNLRELTMTEVWPSLPNTTIDHGIMEHARNVAVVPIDMGWSDVGDWNGLGELIEQDGLGNAVRGDLLQIDTTNSVIWSETGRVIAMVGLDNIIVVDTDDALLVIDREKSQDVRRVVDQLKSGERKELS